MPWSEVVLIIGLSGILGLPVLGFTLYWIAEFLELRVKERKRRLTTAEVGEIRAEITRMQAQVDQLRGTEARLESIEEQIVFLERLVDQSGAMPQLPRGAAGPNRA